jgi:hypothetical protein
VKTATEIRPAAWKLFETRLSLYKHTSPGNDVAGSDLFSTVVYDVAKRLNPLDPLNSANVRKAMEQSWSGVFAYIAATELITQPSTRIVDAHVSNTEWRLFVVTPVAWTMVMFMLLILVCNALLIRHAEVNTSILEKEPIGLLGSALLLHDSDLSKYVADHKGQLSSEKRPNGGIEKTPRALRFWYDPDTRRIRLKGGDGDSKSSPETEMLTPSTAVQSPGSLNNFPQRSTSM